MNRKQFVLTLVAAMIAGLIGGGLSNLVFRSDPVWAQRASQKKPSQKVVEAQEFRLVDQTGKPHAMLGFLDGNPFLVFNDQDSKDRIGLGVGKNGITRLVFLDQDGKDRIGLAVDKDGIPILHFNDQYGKARIVLIMNNDGSPYLGLRDQEEKIRIMLKVDKDGRPYLGLCDKDEKTIWSAP